MIPSVVELVEDYLNGQRDPIATAELLRSLSAAFWEMKSEMDRHAVIDRNFLDHNPLIGNIKWLSSMLELWKAEDKRGNEYERRQSEYRR